MDTKYVGKKIQPVFAPFLAPIPYFCGLDQGSEVGGGDDGQSHYKVTHGNLYYTLQENGMFYW